MYQKIVLDPHLRFTKNKITIKQLCVCLGSCYQESAFLSRAGFGKIAEFG